MWLNHPCLIAKRLALIQHMLCASLDYLEKHSTPQSPDDLAGHQCLVYSLLHNYQSWSFTDKNNQQHTITINPHIKASTGEFLRDAAVNSQGIVYLPTFIVYQEIENRTLIPLLNEYHHTLIDAYAIYPQTRHLSQRVRAFVDFLVKRFEGIPYWDLCLQMTGVNKMKYRTSDKLNIKNGKMDGY